MQLSPGTTQTYCTIGSPAASKPSRRSWSGSQEKPCQAVDLPVGGVDHGGDKTSEEKEGALRRSDWVVMEDHELTGRHGELGVGSALVVAEVHLAGVRPEGFDDGSHLPAHQPPVGQIDDQGHHIEELNLAIHSESSGC